MRPDTAAHPSQSSAAQPAQPPQPELRRAASAHPQPSSEVTTKDVVEAWEVEPDVWELCGEWEQEVQVPIDPRYAGFYDSESDEALRFDISAAVNAYLDTSAPLPACDSDRCAAAGNSTAEPRRCVCMIHPELRSLRSRLDEHELMLRNQERFEEACPRQVQLSAGCSLQWGSGGACLRGQGIGS